MSSRKAFVLAFAVVYTAITGAYSASKWIDASVAHETLHLILFALVVSYSVCTCGADSVSSGVSNK